MTECQTIYQDESDREIDIEDANDRETNEIVNEAKLRNEEEGEREQQTTRKNENSLNTIIFSSSLKSPPV